MTPTKSPHDIAQGLRELADNMLDVATDIDYYGGNNPDWLLKARRLIDSSAILVVWADSIEQKANHDKATQQAPAT